MEVDDEESYGNSEIVVVSDVDQVISPILESGVRRSRRRIRRSLQDTSIVSGHITGDDVLPAPDEPISLSSDVLVQVVDPLIDHPYLAQEVSIPIVAIQNPMSEIEATNADENSGSSFADRGSENVICDEEKHGKKRAISETEDDEGHICPICLDYWTNSGEHRLTSLKCGHLFGHMCIKRWLKGDMKNRYCPTCKMKAHAKDMRFIFAKKIIVSDTAEEDRLRNELEKVTSEKARIELEYQVCLLNLQLQTKQIVELKETNFKLLMNQSYSSSNVGSSSSRAIEIYLEKNLEISPEPGCRVLSYNSHYQYLAVSQKSQGNIFPGFGVKLIDLRNFKPQQFIYLGQKPIRNIQFSTLNMDLLLTVSLDKTAKVYDLQKKSIVLVVTTEMPLWSCCWDGNNPNLFYVGGQQGSVLQYDINNPQICVHSFKVGDMSPVVSLCAIEASAGSPLPRGGVLVCKLNSCWVIETHEAEKTICQLPFEGPFVNLTFEKSTELLLISARPSQKYSKIRHMVSTLDKFNNMVTAREVNTFQGGQHQKLMSRSNLIKFHEDNLVAAFDEEYNGIIVWSTKSAQKIKILPCSHPIMDLCSVQVDSNTYLASLSETALRVYKIAYS